MKQLKFNHDHAQDVVAGKRNATIRIDSRQTTIGDQLQLVDKVSGHEDSWEIPGECTVEGVQTFRLSSLPPEAAEQAEFDSASGMSVQEFLSQFYNQVDDNTIVQIITFTFVPYEDPVPYALKGETENRAPKMVKLYADGGSRGNPGPAAYGFVVLAENDKLIHSSNKYLGVTTNNQAEYQGVVAGLEWCKQHDVQTVEVYLDSLLAVNQLKGIYRVKNEDLKVHYDAAKRLSAAFKKITFTHVPRALNTLADAEANKAMDAAEKKK